MKELPIEAGPVETTTMKDVVYRRLKASIISGRLKPGQRLIEGTLATALNVSRTPLREAIQYLVQDRLVERLPQGGVIVTPISFKEAKQLNDIRSVLEGLAARDATTRIHDDALTAEDHRWIEELKEVLAIMEKFRKVGDIESGLQAGQQFHRLIYRLSGNERLEATLLQIIEGLQRYRALIPIERNVVVIHEHRRIADALLSGNAEAAETCMRAHIAAAEESYRTSIRLIVQ